MYDDLIAYTDTVQKQYQRFLDLFGAKLRDTPEFSCDFSIRNAADLAALIRDRIDRQLPFCLIRLGDGEGACLLEIDDQFPELYRAVVARTLGLHFGRQDYSQEDFTFWRRSISEAMPSADVLACPPIRTCVQLINDRHPDIRGTAGVIGAATNVLDRRALLPAQLFETWHAHVALLPHFSEILRGSRAHLVTCYGDGFAERVRLAFRCERVTATIIPGQALNEGGRLDRPLYPDEMQRVSDEVGERAERGLVVLVAAGLAGKSLCALAAKNGAVAIDVGSMMDVWHGRGVRPYQTDEFVANHALQD